MFYKNFTILHSFPVWLPQTQTWMYSQVNELQLLGINAHVVCERKENLEQFGVANIHCLSDEPRWQQIYDKGLRKLRLRRHLNYLVQVGKCADTLIVHSHFGNIAWKNLDAVSKLGAKHVATFYGQDSNKLPQQFPKWRKRYAKLFAEVDLIFCEGSHLAKCIVDLGCPAHKVKVQHLGVDVEQFEFRPRRWRVGETLRVLIAASFREKKGITFAIEALGNVSRAIPIELTIIGDAGQDFDSQKEKERILAALERSGLRPFTRLLGYQSHARLMTEAYQHHIFLHPSVVAKDGDSEGGAPVCITEMLATGMPVVSTTHCDIPEVLGPNLHHWLAPERNTYALSACLSFVIRNSTHWHEWTLTGRRRVEAEYNQAKQAKQLVSRYEQLESI